MVSKLLGIKPKISANTAKSSANSGVVSGGKGAKSGESISFVVLLGMICRSVVIIDYTFV